MTFGVTPEGFIRPSVQEIKEEIERDELAGIDPTLDIATDPVVGQINGIFAQQLGKAWEALETAYDAFDPDKAEDDRLRSLSKLTGTEPQGATKTIVACTIGLDQGVTLEAGVHFANVIDKPDVRFTPKQNYTSPSDGLHEDILFECEQLGPIVVFANTLKVIATPVVGWDSINNPSAGTPGVNADGNPELRERRERELAQRGSATKDAIEAAVSAVNGVRATIAAHAATRSSHAATAHRGGIARISGNQAQAFGLDRMHEIETGYQEDQWTGLTRLTRLERKAGQECPWLHPADPVNPVH